MGYNTRPWPAASTGLLLCLTAGLAPSVFAQELVAIPPPMAFETSTEHYEYLKERADGGTKHTISTVPQWLGLWGRGSNNNDEIFLEDAEEIDTNGDGRSLAAGGTDARLSASGRSRQVRAGVLTPPYEEAFRQRRQEQLEKGQQQYDRLTHCEPPGYPRHLREPYTREFVNLPHQSWHLNDFMNETRRIYIEDEHKNLYGTHSWLGDTIGFWDGDRLITHTVDLLPVDYFRGQPLTSNQFEAVEIWEMKTLDDGSQRLEVQTTFYDELALVKPINAVYAFTRDTDLMEAGLRIRHWECETSSNSYRTADGSTQFFLPNEAEYKDPRGYTLFPDLPGQSRDPIYNTELQPD